MRTPITHCLFLLSIVLVSNGFSQSSTEVRLISMPEYVLSPEQAAAGIDGQLLLSVSIDSKGDVTNVIVIAGPSWPCGSNPSHEIAEVRSGIRKNALEAKFAPPTKDGKPHGADMFVRVMIGKKLEEYKRQLASGPQALEQGKPRRIKAGIVNGRAIRLARPSYPDEARAHRAAGPVEVDVIIDEQGRVAQAGAISGLPVLQTAARDAACASIFSPTILEGHPVQVMGIITYNFVT